MHSVSCKLRRLLGFRGLLSRILPLIAGTIGNHALPSAIMPASCLLRGNQASARIVKEPFSRLRQELR